MSEDVSCNGFLSAGTVEKVPMHPEDFRALLAWVRAKEDREMSNWRISRT